MEGKTRWPAHQLLYIAVTCKVGQFKVIALPHQYVQLIVSDLIPSNWGSLIRGGFLIEGVWLLVEIGHISNCRIRVRRCGSKREDQTETRKIHNERGDKGDGETSTSRDARKLLLLVVEHLRAWYVPVSKHLMKAFRHRSIALISTASSGSNCSTYS